MGIHKSMNPMLISCYESDFELIIVETKIGKTKIRFITGYGPQEDWTDDLKAPFFNALDQEISKAQSDNISVYIAMDANCKHGTKYIPNDPHHMSKNGEIMEDIIERNALIVVNGLQSCEGVITRTRDTEDGRTKKSAIDIVLVSAALEEDVLAMKIDEERNNVLTKKTTDKKGVVKKTQSDHNIIETNLNISFNKYVPKEKVEMYNLKNKQCQIKFKDYTCKTNMETIFDSDKDINILTKKFLKRLDGAIVHCFKKIRSNKKNNSNLERLYSKLNALKNDADEECISEIEKVEQLIASEATQIVIDKTKGLSNDHGGTNPNHLWKLKSKIIPKPPQNPTAMKDPNGLIVTTEDELKKHTINHYENVLRNRTIHDDLKAHKKG